jgi:hypothetical protein
VPKLATRRDWEVPALAGQLIWPYTNLLLHDMGDGLADHRPEGVADGREWRTPPLWGIGLTEEVNGHTYFLHDGRARDLTEAILWHGGEAQAARDAFRGHGQGGSRRSARVPELALRRAMRACLIPLLMVVLAAAAPARAQSPLEQLNQALVDGVIIPGYEGSRRLRLRSRPRPPNSAPSRRRSAWRLPARRSPTRCWPGSGSSRSSSGRSSRARGVRSSSCFPTAAASSRGN